MSIKDWVKFCVVGLVWGSTFLWVKIAIQEIGPFTLVAYRVFFSLLTMLIYYLVKRPGSINKLLIVPSIILGMMNLVFPQLLISYAEQFIPSWLASILMSSVPFLTIIFAISLFSEERITLSKAIGLGTGFVGVVILVFNQSGQGGVQNYISVFACLLAALCFAASNVYSRVKTRHIPPEVLTLGTLIASSFVIIPAAWLAEGPMIFPKLPTTWIALIFMGVLNGGLVMALFFSLIHTIGPSRTSLVAYIFPLAGVVLGIIFLAERPDWQLLVGAPLIIAGVLIVNANTLGLSLKKKLIPVSDNFIKYR
ncbi:MAG: DMT family transporter [Anaerolineaceae bacterium]|nr:DMT family transporter [Anaerolineaceae bacterium]